ncbi:hypothetical protein AM501_29785 [Aneurinibacillus migulanus]|uniref:SPOR domain-containing protein n=1 Tax=Aneurinibacillus migulanus TaxID=47500 RepID=UPI0005BB5045|nr:SPOR domain-containing protein [Aneurinibacillus migulanus]KIV59177.1 hypothetical protein TS64_03620 [Aneurinibacillus migulanus]KPD04793.1 hypothetical protein AM501_29785 [Aneurinibacillus migulanus]MCP1355318.1 SPOR domain-containing protein [Aneurinibacillus migulanus]CEH28238.1 Sporulation and cell division repeat protein [Aneurinibacillus migulanus]
MKNSPAYKIRIRPETEQSRSEARASTASHKPKIKLNQSPVSIISPEAEPVVDIRTEESESKLTENSTSFPMMERPDINIEEIETIDFRPSRPSPFMKKKWTGHTFKPPKNIFRFGAVAGGAVAVGLLLGYVVLQTFTMEPTNPEEKVPAAIGQAKQTPQDKAAGQAAGAAASEQVKTNETANKPKTKPLTVTLPVVPLYLVQGGVFSTKAGAEQERTVFQQKGWPTHMEEDAGKHTLFLGVSASRDDALSLAEAYRASKQEVYIKEKSLPAGTVTLNIPEGMSADAAEEIKHLGQAQADLFQIVSQSIGDGFKGGKISQATLDKILTRHKEALKQGRSATEVLGEQQKALLQSALNEMTTAVTTLQQFAGQPNRTYLWQAEENMLRFISSYKRWQQAMTG